MSLEPIFLERSGYSIRWMAPGRPASNAPETSPVDGFVRSSGRERLNQQLRKFSRGELAPISERVGVV